MRRIFTIVILLSAVSLAQTVSSDFKPANTGQNLGADAQRWNIYAQDVNVGGLLTVQTFNSLQYAGNGVSIAQAVSSCGSSQCTVIIPSNYSGTECPTPTANVVFEDYRAGGRTLSGTSSYVCSGNVVQRNVKTPGLTDSMIRSEMTRNSVDPTGSIVSFYPITHLSNATASGGVVDGDAPEAMLEGTFSGSLSYLTGSEIAASVMSTGGNVNIAVGALGYVDSSVGSTTAISNAYGVWGKGCSGQINGAAPTNCYGGFFSRQLGAASGRNYSVGIEGLGVLIYDSSTGVGGLDCEDTGHANHRCLLVDSSNNLILRAVSTSGVRLQDALGNTAITVNASGAVLGATLDANSNAITHVSSFGISNSTITSVASSARAVTLPDASGFAVLDTASQTLTNKTLTSPTINTPVITNPTIAAEKTGSASNTDLAGSVTLSGGAGSYNFTGTYATAPICVATDTTAANAVKVSTSTTVLSLTGTTTDVINYICVGRT